MTDLVRERGTINDVGIPLYEDELLQELEHGKALVVSYYRIVKHGEPDKIHRHAQTEKHFMPELTKDGITQKPPEIKQIGEVIMAASDFDEITSMRNNWDALKARCALLEPVVEVVRDSCNFRDGEVYHIDCGRLLHGLCKVLKEKPAALDTAQEKKDEKG